MVEVLVRDQGRDAEVEVLAGPASGRGVEVGVDRRLDHPALAAVAAGDPVADRLRDRHEVRDPARGRAVPAPEPVEQRPGQGPADRPVGPGVEVGVAAVPGVPHRGEAVADVRDAPGRPDHLGHAMAQADDEVDLARLARTGRPAASAAGACGSGRKTPGTRWSGEGRIVIASIAGLERAPVVDQGVQGGVGEGPAEDLQALLAAPHPGQPVVDQRDPEAREAAGEARRVVDATAPLGCWRPCRPPGFLAVARVATAPGPVDVRAGGYPT